MDNCYKNQILEVSNGNATHVELARIAIVLLTSVSQDWPRLPRGVRFDPTDQEIIFHLLAKCRIGNLKCRPFINELIPTVNKEDGICYTHPQNLPRSMPTLFLLKKKGVSPTSSTEQSRDTAQPLKTGVRYMLIVLDDIVKHEMSETSYAATAKVDLLTPGSETSVPPRTKSTRF